MNRGNIKLNNPERFSGRYEIPHEKVQKAIDKALDKLSLKLDLYMDKFPGVCTQDCRYQLVENSNWTHGLHTGVFFLAYELSGDKRFFEVGKNHIASYQKRLYENINLNDHDVGFVFSPSVVAYHKLTGDEIAKQTAILAAEHLYVDGYSEKGGFIMRVGRKQHIEPFCRTMMDTLMNIPLFYWAGEQTGNQKFVDAANSQVNVTANYLIREDASSNHHYQFEVGTHKPLHGVTVQGHRDDSTWSRGHSWGVLGLPIAYTYTGDESLLPLHRDITYYMLNHLPDDYIPYWDYDFTSGDEPRDSSAAAIAVCGMLEAIRYLPDCAPEKEIYQTAASRMLESLIDTCATGCGKEFDGLIYKVTPCKALPEYGIEVCASYGDYFYLEALMRYINPDWKRYW
ncbi:MAG: glycoside hydrolase family 88 protein [Clostridia bacterium]|nr:glycoside hydrolase family 88 protein [Clostridia bacterium]